MIEQSGDPATPTAFGVQQSQADHAVVLAVSGEVDMLTAPQLAEAIQTALAAGPPALIVDLSKVDFLASAGMTVLVTANAQVVAPPVSRWWPTARPPAGRSNSWASTPCSPST
ncbi:STAS domain protein [Mycobacterium kansasii]|uniref:STAS domain protein n=1 Tax=Mycobacterium kansasii TaxID=1768 RepID=A0A1V3WW54_MYCKA|nr:STAS domain protein [Mycobacterium kansasii]